jgi:hypothetical protein
MQVTRQLPNNTDIRGDTMKRPGQQTYAVRQANLEAVLAAICDNGGRIIKQETRTSRRRRHGIPKFKVVTIITVIGGRLISQSPATFRPHTPRCTTYGNRHDLRVSPGTVSIPRRR